MLSTTYRYTALPLPRSFASSKGSGLRSPVLGKVLRDDISQIHFQIHVQLHRQTNTDLNSLYHLLLNSSMFSQAHADQMRNMSAAAGMGQTGWERDPEMDLRCMTDVLRQTPHQVALRRNNWAVAQLLHPNMSIADALDMARSTDEGIDYSTADSRCTLCQRVPKCCSLCVVTV